MKFEVTNEKYLASLKRTKLRRRHGVMCYVDRKKGQIFRIDKVKAHTRIGHEGPEARVELCCFSNLRTRCGSVVNSTLRPLYLRKRDTVRIVQEAGWAPGPVWTRKKVASTGIRSPDLSVRSESLCRLRNPGSPLEIYSIENFSVSKFSINVLEERLCL
jgi:hypothetical protein